MSFSEKKLTMINSPANPQTITLWEKILMTIKKSDEPSIKLNISPATIGLAFTLIVQGAIGIWWAATTSKTLEDNNRQIIELKSKIDTDKVYIDNVREKVIKDEATMESIQSRIESLQTKTQLEQLLQQKK